MDDIQQPTVEETVVAPDISAQEIMLDILSKAEEHTAITTAFLDNFVFQGKTLSEWLLDLAVDVPREINPETLRDSLALCARKMQKAYYFYTTTNTMLMALTAGSETKHKDLVTTLVTQYERRNARRPAAGILDSMAETYLAKAKNQQTAAKILKEFFKDRRDSLVEVRKTLEQLGLSMHMEMKYHEHD